MTRRQKLVTVSVSLAIFAVPVLALRARCGPADPCHLRVTGRTRSTITLSWSIREDGGRFRGYAVMRREDDGPYRIRAQLPQGSRTMFTDTELAATSTYTYKLRRVGAGGTVLGTSREVSAKPRHPPPPAAAIPSPTSPGPLGTRTLSGSVSFPTGFIVPAGGRWRFDPDVSTTVQAGANVVVRGVLEMRPASAGVVHTLRFIGIDEREFVGGGDEVVPSDKGLWVVDAGRLEIAGTPKTPYVHASGDVAAGATVLETASPVSGWLPGDALTITPTAVPTSPDFSTFADSAVSSASGSRVVLATPVVGTHPAVNGAWAAEILNLTRNVRIHGHGQQAACPIRGNRAHVWIKSSAPQTISYAEIRFMGPRQDHGDTIGDEACGGAAGTRRETEAVLGRYALHFHHSLDGTSGSLVEGVVVHDSGSHAFVAHESNGITFRNNIAHNTFDEAYWWDPGTGTNDTLYDGNVASLIHTDPDFRGFQNAGFWMGRGRGNIARHNVAVGVEGTTNASGFIWPEDNSGIWVFEDNLAHNNAVNGIFTWQNTSQVHTITRFTAYRNGQDGIEHGAYQNPYMYQDSILFGNARSGVHVHANSSSEVGDAPNLFKNIVIDGEGMAPYAYLAEEPVVDGDPTHVVCPRNSGYTKAEYGLAYAGNPRDRVRVSC